MRVFLTTPPAERNVVVSHPFRAAVEAADIEAALGLLAPNVTFHSPVQHAAYEGVEATSVLLRAVFEDFHYTDELSGPDVHALILRARVGDRDVEGIDILRPASGPVEDFTVMVRPLSAAMALGEAVRRQLGLA
jgi:hypothetical protein